MYTSQRHLMRTHPSIFPKGVPSMELQTKALDIMFRRLSPEQMIRSLVGVGDLPDEESFQNTFLAYAETTLKGYSYNEQEAILRHFCPHEDESPKRNRILPPFLALCNAADRYLTPGIKGPECRFEEAVNWREAYLLLGQDLFTCAWLARNPERRLLQNSFTWPVVIPTDNRILHEITRGAAENHMHLYAGASVYSLSWICLMNHPDVNGFQEKMASSLSMHGIRDESANLWPVRRRMLYAAFLRTILFQRLHHEQRSLLLQLREFHAGYSTEAIVSSELKERVDALRHVFGVRFQQPGYQESACLDYAFTRSLSHEKEKDYRLLAGERQLLFHCFCLLFQSKLTWGDQWVLYLYLLLKAQVRSELIQINHQVGFSNFHDYDSRKKLLWKPYPEFFNEDIRQSINAPIREQHISSLEGRICPRETVQENLASVFKIDRSALFFGATFRERELLRDWETCSCMENLADGQKYFLVLHFPKESDKMIDTDLYASTLCRHDQFRQDIRACGIELAKALVNCQYFCERIRGIDACSQEIGCRPEVFAILFRFLRSFRPEDYWNGLLPACSPRLGVTYHVGEDFLDLADGLRAMDEALHFLDLRHGDRLGHAIALGVAPQIHYACKFNQSILPKQDLLDNLTWIYYRSAELQVEIPELLRKQIRAKMYALFHHIYGKEGFQSTYSLRNYYDSMFLRGDDPRCYCSGTYRAVPITDQFDRFCVNTNRDELHPLSDYRKNNNVVALYYLYHYNLGVKRRGSETEVWTVDAAYISLMSRLQQAMQKRINRMGISIECNPSSNVLIGTFGTYQEHPILSFNTMGLTNTCSDTQMHVSINSDDPGVFDTTVSFEYELLASALSNKKDVNGHYLYSDRQIEAYLRNIVQMGKEQVFPPSRGAFPLRSKLSVLRSDA